MKNRISSFSKSTGRWQPKNIWRGNRLTWLAGLLVGAAVIFNFFTLRPELNIKADPNDNIFQFALTERMSEVFENCKLKIENCKFLIDHWVPTWASGYPLPFYYQHLPHLLTVIIYNLIIKKVNLYNIFNWIKFGFWVFLPVSWYISCRWLGFGKLTSALAAFFGSQILTDGLYGADISSFAWRGYGLSTQLWAIFFAPLALGAFYRLFRRRQAIKTKDLLVAVLLLAATFASHLAFGYFIVLSLLLLPLTFLPWEEALQLFTNFTKEKLHWLAAVKKVVKKYVFYFFLFTFSFLLLSYWFVPLLLENIYHNVSFWDPPVKWNSYGAKEVISMLLNGQLLDFGRPPILTYLLGVGFFVSLWRFRGKYRFFAFLFPFWLALYFGRTTWGPLIDLLPMMKEMHQQRLINGLHLVSFPLIGVGAFFVLQKFRQLATAGLKIGLDYLEKSWPATKKMEVKILNGGRILSSGVLIFLLGVAVYKANANYLYYNRIWLGQANENYQTDEADFQKLVATIKSLPRGRTYAGTPGNWGREFKIGATQVYLALSTAGVPLVGFLPESWSLNTDPEPFFNYENPRDYNLWNVRYLVTPKDFPLPKFAKLIGSFGRFNLSQVESEGYFTLGTSNISIKLQKNDILNIIHLWLLSDLPAKKEFPTLVLDAKAPRQIFFPPALDYPLSQKLDSQSKIIKEEIVGEKYQATVEVSPACQNCLLVFKMTYHPNWQVKINGQLAKKFMVFPSFMAVKLSPGRQEISFEYRPDSRKLPLILLGIGFLGILPLAKKLL